MAAYVVRVRRSRLFNAGALLFAVGCGPLLAVIAAAGAGLTADPEPNPVGFGILALFTFWPSVVLMLCGLAAAVRVRA